MTVIESISDAEADPPRCRATSSPGSPPTPTQRRRGRRHANGSASSSSAPEAAVDEHSPLAPTITPDTQFFWDGLKEHRAADPAVRRRAAPCATRPARCARRCNSLEWDTRRVGGPGHGVQLRDAPPPALPVVRAAVRRRARRPRGRASAWCRTWSTSTPTTPRSAWPSRCSSSTSTTASCCPSSARRRTS